MKKHTINEYPRSLWMEGTKIVPYYRICTQTTKIYRSLDKGEKVWKRRNVIFAEVQNTNNEGQIIYIPIRGITCWSQTHLWKSAKTAEWSIMMPVS